MWQKTLNYIFFTLFILLSTSCKQEQVVIEAEPEALGNCTDTQLELLISNGSGVVEHYKVVEQMPRFPSQECEELNVSDAQKKQCADERMLAFIEENLNYPQSAIDAQIQGTVVVESVVHPSGCLRYIKIRQGLTKECDEESLRIVQSMPNSWIPGRQQGELAYVILLIPVSFRL